MPSAADLCFPPGFVFGASTSAYQTEGDNRGSDVWGWEARRGWERSGKASNSFELWEEDIRCAETLGLRAYRFSVEWGRIFPEPGRPDGAALAHYRRIVERLEAAGIRPIVCLHHFTHPRWLLERHPGLWAESGAVEAFVEYARAVADALPAREWIPFNEPMVHVGTGYLSGIFPPGRRLLLGPAHSILAGPARNMAEAHRRVYALLKAKDPGARVGIAHNVSAVEPLSAPRDTESARLWDEFFHWAFLDALVFGRMDADLDGVRETVLGEGGTLDFIGVNYYTRLFVRRVPRLLPPANALPLVSDASTIRWLGPLYRFMTWGRATRPTDDVGRECFPEGLRTVLEAAHRRYGLPLLVTENGVADASGAIRALELVAHLAGLRKRQIQAPVVHDGPLDLQKPQIPTILSPRTIIAVNVGGAVIPVALSIYLMFKNRLYLRSLLGVGIVAAAVHLMAYPVPGLGIAEPAARAEGAPAGAQRRLPPLLGSPSSFFLMSASIRSSCERIEVFSGSRRAARFRTPRAL